MEHVAHGLAGDTEATVADGTTVKASVETPSVSVETLCWLALLGIAFAIRLAGLGGSPFTVSESLRAVDALSVSRGDIPSTWTGDAGAAAVSYLFDIFEESAALARLPAAIGGAALVAALWFARPHAGRLAALAAAALIVLSPMFVLYSRSAEPFGIGPAVAVLAAISLIAYVREPGTGWLFSFTLFAGLATLTDAVAVTALLAIIAFIGLEALVVGNEQTSRAWDRFRSSPQQWAVLAVVAGATLQLGLSHFGTSTDRSGFAGLTQFGEMFDAPRDSRPAAYHFVLLIAYDWPIVIAGTGGLVALSWRAAKSGLRPLSPFERLLLVWVAVAVLTLAFLTQREGGQILILLLPLALLAGSLAESLARRLDWGNALRCWPLAATLLLLVMASALLLTLWSSGQASGAEQALIFVFASAAVVVALGALTASRAAGGAVTAVVAVLAVLFSAHSALAVAFQDGDEPANDAVLLETQVQFRRTLDTLAGERAGIVVIDAGLHDELAWTLRDTPYLYGNSLEDATIFVGPAGEAPPSFTPVGGAWLISQRWYPDEVLKPRSMWKWLLYRDAFGPLETTSVQIYVPTV
jgi:hypothetical protein